MHLLPMIVEVVFQKVPQENLKWNKIRVESGVGNRKVISTVARVSYSKKCDYFVFFFFDNFNKKIPLHKSGTTCLPTPGGDTTEPSTPVVLDF